MGLQEKKWIYKFFPSPPLEHREEASARQRINRITASAKIARECARISHSLVLGIYLSYDLVMTTTQMSSSSIIPPLNHALGIIHSYSESRTRLRTTKRGSNTKEFGNQ